MEDALKNVGSAMSEINAAFMELTTTNGKFKMQLRQEEDHIRSLQSEMCNLKVATSTQTTNGGGFRNVRRNFNTHKKKYISQWPSKTNEIIYNNKNNCWTHGYDTSELYSSSTFTQKQLGEIRKQHRATNGEI